MRLILLRHGEAEARPNDDPARRLTEAGRQDVLAIARRFRAAGIEVGRCLVSPYLRARQTAELFLPEAAPAVRAETLELLRPESSASELIRFLDEQDDGASVLLVSHNPLLSELNALLTEGNFEHLLILGPADLVAIDLEMVGLGLGRRLLYLSPDPQFAKVDH